MSQATINTRLHKLHMKLQREIKCDSHVLAYVQHNATREMIGNINRMYWDMEKELIKKEWDIKMDKLQALPRVYLDPSIDNVF